MIQSATEKEVHEVATLALQLWKGHSLETMVSEMRQLISQGDAKVFIAYHNHQAIGFAQCQLRHDYVEGTSSSPVGYLEGLFVKEEFRKQGFARELVQTCEKWARDKECREFASDCELDNEESFAMHVKLGFIETNRIVCFKKDL